MRGIGILLIVATLAAWVVILPEQIAGYRQQGEKLEEAYAEGEALRATPADAVDERVTRDLRNVTDEISRGKAFRSSKVQGIAVVGGGGLIAMGLGLYLIRRGRRALGRGGSSPAAPGGPSSAQPAGR